ncbi:MAG: hypothetical protein KA603_16230 [Azonexus sp.]|nr:hypothetical protein [Betaproteobacteria bacterium]MBP6037672.1 hypothetical protein [Azonexus sp.]MBP6908178.1 hypothetical protein [Azonexus sp.]
MHGLETLIRLNRTVGLPDLPGRILRRHPRIASLRLDVAQMKVDDNYRRWLYRSLNLYADAPAQERRCARSAGQSAHLGARQY